MAFATLNADQQVRSIENGRPAVWCVDVKRLGLIFRTTRE